MDENMASNKAIGAAIEVHRMLGPGLLESIYQRCMAYELEQTGVAVEQEAALPMQYKELRFDAAYRLDLLVEGKVILELKAVDAMLPVFKAQLLSYLKMSGLKLGLLVNFNVPQLKHGIIRVVNNL